VWLVNWWRRADGRVVVSGGEGGVHGGGARRRVCGRRRCVLDVEFDALRRAMSVPEQQPHQLHSAHAAGTHSPACHFDM